MIRPKIAILCNFPAWLISQKVPVFLGHYAVWLKALYDSYPEDGPYELHWISLNKDISSPIRFTARAQHFHILPRVKKTIGLYTAYVTDRCRIARELRLIKPDLLHTWGTEDCFGLCGKDFKGKWLHSVQGLLKACMQRGPMPRFFRHHSVYEPGVLRASKYITTESPWAAERVREMAPQASPYLFEYAVEERFFNQERALADSPSCLYCGSNTPLKNLECAIAAFSRPELAHVKLELAGVEPGSIPGLPGNVIPLGRISRDEVVQKLSQAWCLVHPSKADTGPTAAKEARVMGVPVIISDQCGSKQYVDEGKSGYIISPSDAEALVRGALDITSSSERCQEMGQHQQEQCRQALSAQAMINRLIEIYHQVLTK
ncbi:MAG: glycosyltransferase [Akkermansia sp.]|nr:glycosyltransferase [Akkermansia sp.]